MFSFLDPNDLQEPLCTYLQRDSIAIQDVSTSRLSLGTSGDELYAVRVAIRGDDEPLRLILKISRPGEETEAQFYRTLAHRVPVATPRLAASGSHDGRSWILMEQIKARDGLTWTAADYQPVVEDMAALHATFWGRTESLDEPWLWRPTPPAVAEVAVGLQAVLKPVDGSWLVDGVPEIFAPDRLKLIRQVLAALPQLTEALLQAGASLVHADYWFHNVLITPDGRRVLVDWQGCRIFSGFWDLAYFLNLLRAVGPGTYRPLPVPEQQLVDWYHAALEAREVYLNDHPFNRTLTVAKVIQPLVHWLPQVARSATKDPWKDTPAARAHRAFLGDTFDEWEQAVRFADI